MNNRVKILIGVLAVVAIASGAWMLVLNKKPVYKPVRPAAAKKADPAAKDAEPAAKTAEAPKPPKKVSTEEHDPGTEKTFAGMPFVWCPAGEFEQSAKKTALDIANAVGGREEWYGDSYPAFTVKIPSGFWLGKTEVTRAQWAEVMNTAPEKGEPAAPIANVTWRQCQEFIQKLGEKKEGVFDLPTESEWEYACRAGSSTFFYFGDNVADLEEAAWLRSNTGDGELRPAGQKKNNAWGLCDMLGNAWEWCADEYASYGPLPRPIKGYRVIRGGGVNSFAGQLLTTYRLSFNEEQGNPRLGLRLKREAD